MQCLLTRSFYNNITIDIDLSFKKPYQGLDKNITSSNTY